MRKDVVQYLEHRFASFSLRKEHGAWLLDGQKSKLTTLEIEVLVRLVEEKGYVVNVEQMVGRRSNNPERILYNIRKALDANFKKADQKCEYIETVQRQGAKWYYEPVVSHGFACVELGEIVTRSSDTAMEMGFLKARIESRLKTELNLNIYTKGRPDDALPRACCAIDGNCLNLNGEYWLILKLSCAKLTDGQRNGELRSNSLYQLIEDATDWVVDTLKDLIPEAIRNS